MDYGIVCKYYSVDEAIENGAAPVPLSFDKTIDIMDHLLTCEVFSTLHFSQPNWFPCVLLSKL